MKLNKKLSCIASMIEKGKNVIDVGCDHALLDIFLTLYNENHCIASDIKKSAIEGAFRNLKKYKVEDKVTLVVSDGFHNIPIRTHETIVISGMGTATILNIMKQIPYDKIDRVIISSNNDLKELRYYMMNNNFIIQQELVVCENHIFYVIIEFGKGTAHYNEKELQYGPILLKQRSIDRDSYYHYLITINNEIIRKLPSKSIGKKFKLWKENLFLKHNTK